MERVTHVEVGGVHVPITARVRGVRTRDVIEVEALEGDGQETAIHQVRYYFTLDGALLARVDEFEES